MDRASDVNESAERVTGVLASAETSLAGGDVEATLAVLADGLAVHGPDLRLLALAASAWVTLVDQGRALENWAPAKRDALLRHLIVQEDCGVDPPILHHRIAAQHTGGVAGHLNRQGKALGSVLETLLAEARPHPKAILLALLLREALPGIDQDRLSDLHRQAFAMFKVGDLQIPYSVIFDRHSFRRNVTDLAAYVADRGLALVEGGVPLPHLLLLFWLVPQSFDALPEDWAARAVRQTRGRPLSADDAAVIRSLELRFDIRPPSNEALTPCADNLAALRCRLAGESQGGDIRSVAHLEQRPRQAVAGLLNMARTRIPALRSRRRLRVAICISGQLRGFRRAWPTWRPLLADVDATVFVDSWRKIGHGTPEPFRSTLPFEGAEFCAAYKRVGTEIGLEELRLRYPTLFAALDQGGTVDERTLQAVYRTPHVRLDDETDAAFAAFTNSDKMYYKIQRCSEMMQSADGDFDLVVRFRPDKPIQLVAFQWAELLAALRARPALYAETALGAHYGALLMGDQVAIGLPEAMRVYAGTFSLSPPIAALAPYRMEQRLWGHTSIAQFCWFADLDVRKVPIKFGPFMEAEPLAAEAIALALRTDSAGRMDVMDKQLIDAIQSAR
ncbi:hypothetical protein ACU5AX_19290 [Sphingomonas sp. XXL09]|uniref:hypothetical protein n=1 Tax=Sphingomonas sp. XXL09 TaxID=3457787 RepID=UPI00406BC832